MASEELKIFTNEEFQSEDIEFSRRTFFGSAIKSRFIRCNIHLNPKGIPAYRDGSRFLISQCVFEDCSVTAIGKLKALDFTHAVKIHRCRFTGGSLVEAKFGAEGIEAPSEPWVKDCDFSAVDLRDVRFYQTQTESVVLPTWPFITAVAQENGVIFAAPSLRRPALTLLLDEVSDFDWEDLPLQRAMESLVFGVGLKSTQASIQVCHAEDVIKRGAGSMERLRTALERFAHPAIRY